MKLIIDIDEEVKHKVYAYGLSLCPNDKEQLIKAIKNGIPLPKGYGRLIDADAVNIEETIGEKNEFADCIREAIQAVLDNAPTILEADKESEDDNS